MSALPARLLLELAARAGIDQAPLVAGLGFDAGTLPRLRRVRWDAYCAIAERLEAAAGGPEAGAALMAVGYHLSTPPELQWMVEAFASPSALVRGIVEVINPALFPMVDGTVEELAADRLLITLRLRRGARPCLTFMRGSATAFANITRRLDLPPATLELRELSDRSLCVVMLLPASRPRSETPARPADLDMSQALLRYFALEVQALDATVHAQAEVLNDIGALGRELTEHRELGSLAAALMAMLTRLGFERAALHLTAGGGAARSWRHEPSPGEMTRTFALASPLGAIGKLEVGGPGDAATLEQLVPWIGLVVEQAQRRESDVARATGDEERSLHTRLASARHRLRLTSRQAEVLAFVVQGRSNKEIAAVLECAENTVEFHVTHLLRKSRSQHRAQLVARFWAGTLVAADGA